jgi:hypothetical protein
LYLATPLDMEFVSNGGVSYQGVKDYTMITKSHRDVGAWFSPLQLKEKITL